MSKENIFWSAVLGLVIGACAAAVMWLTGYRSNVPSDGAGIEHIRDEFANAEDAQSRAAESLDRAGRLAESAAERNREIADGNRSIQDSERRDEEIIRESEQILERIRARTKE